jgi:integrase
MWVGLFLGNGKGGKHPDKALTALAIRNLTRPGKYADGNGLYVVVEKTGAKRWLLRLVIQGHRRDIGLGGLTLVTLAEAREIALTMRKVARSGGDPVADRHRRDKTLSFAMAAEQVHSEHNAAWSNAKHSMQWINTLRSYAFPIIGDLPIDKVGTPEVMKVLSPIWLSKPETARRVRQRLGTVFDWAKASGLRSGDNPVDGVTKGLPRQTDRDVHHAALPHAQVCGFIVRLQAEGRGELARLAFEFLILTASRTSEVLGMLKAEVDTTEKTWTVPSERMKARDEHRVPLSDRALAILDRARELAPGSRFVFPGNRSEEDKPLSGMVFLMALRRMKVSATPHGFRSSFRDWVSEATNYSGELAEMALAHTIQNRVEAAYRRGDLLEQRRALMQSWSDYVCQTQGHKAEGQS